MEDPYHQKTTLADLVKVVNDLDFDAEVVYIDGRISYPYPPLNEPTCIPEGQC